MTFRIVKQGRVLDGSYWFTLFGNQKGTGSNGAKIWTIPSHAVEFWAVGKGITLYHIDSHGYGRESGHSCRVVFYIAQDAMLFKLTYA